MVEIGNLSIGGSIQTAEIERGLLRIEIGLKDIGNVGKSVGSDFERINAKGKRLTKTFGALAIAGTTAILGLAKGAPALAGSMAKINVSMLKLKMSAGEALKPTFDVISEKLNGLANWTNEHPDLFAGTIKSVGLLAAAFSGFKIIEMTGLTTALTGFLGLSAGSGFLVFVAAVTTLTASFLSIKQYMKDIGNLRESGTTFEKVKYAATTGPLGAGPGNMGIGDLFMNWLKNNFKKESRNQSEIEGSDFS